MLTCASFFAGVGGIDMGFENTGAFKTVYANEFDAFPVKTFEKNFDLKVDCRDIHDVAVEDIPDFDVRQPSAFEQIKTITGDVFGWVEKNQGKLLDAYNLFQSIRGGQPINIPSGPVDGIPPIPE